MSNQDSIRESRLRLRDNRLQRPSIIAHHLILTGYGHWLPNDPRGSGSHFVRRGKLVDLGEVHVGRKRVQPPKEELREFFQQARPRLDFEPLWFDVSKRQAIAKAFEELVRRAGYVVWACAVLKNHAHLCMRKHRDDARLIWERFVDASRETLREFCDVAEDHPVWSDRPYKVFLYTPADVRRVVRYVEENPEKEGLSRQRWPFVEMYNDWPFHKGK